MTLPTLESFIQENEECVKYPGNAYVSAIGFSELYIRIGPRYLNGTRYEKVIDIARITSTIPGAGAFTKLVKQLQDYDFVIYVECVQNPKFVNKLIKMKFERDLSIIAGYPCFFLKG